MKKKTMSLFARTPIHVGAGNSVGAVDSPVMRERHTRIPIIPGSSLKGVLADLWLDNLEWEEWESGMKSFRKSGSELEKLFGQTKNDKRDTKDQAGKLLVGEARVLAFPVRSAKGAFAWVTCPLALRRFERDADMKIEIPNFSENGMNCIAGKDVILNEAKVVLEEYLFENKGSSEVIAKELLNLSDDPVWKTLESRLVIVSDEMFSYFVEHTCEVVTRICVDDETGTVKTGALFNQEQVPSETMFYAVFAEAGKDSAEVLDILAKRLESVGNTIQVGGDATIGLGCCTIKLI